MAKSLTEVAKSIIMNEEVSNAATLKPGSKSADATKTLGSATKIADAPVEANPGSGSNVGSAAAAPVSKDNSKPTQGAKPAEPAKKIGGEVMEEDIEETSGEVVSEEEEIEISEELQDFIDALVAEGKTEDEIADAINENFELVSEEDKEEKEDDEDEKDEKELDEGSSAVNTAPAVDMSEDIDALFAGESELSEDFKNKAKTIFEAAVSRKLEEQKKIMEQNYAETLAEEVESIKSELAENVDDYLNYVVEQWSAENEVAIEAGLRSELTEEFISGLKNLFAEHYIDIPDDKVNVVEELGAKVEELENKLNEEIERSVNLNKQLNESKVNEILTNACDGLTDTQVEKLKSLAEGIEYSDASEYSQKITTLRESYFPTNVKSDKVLDVAETVSDGKTMIAEELSGPMAKYVKTLGKTLPR